MTELHVSNVPFSSTEIDVRILLENWFEKGSVICCELKRDPLTLQHKGYGFVTLSDKGNAEVLVCLASDDDHEFVLQDRLLRFQFSNRASSSKSMDNGLQVEAGLLSLGFLIGGTLHVLWESHLDVTLEYDLANRKFAFLVDVLLIDVRSNSRLRQYKLEFLFKYVFDIRSSSTAKGGMAFLLELMNPPLVYKRIDVWQQEDPSISEMRDLMQVPSENQGRWFRTIDFTPCCSIGHSLAYVLAIPETKRSVLTEVFHGLRKALKMPARPKQLTLKAPKAALQSQILVPILNTPHTHHISFKLFFKLNHLVQVGSLQSSLLSDEFYALLSRTPTENSLWVMQEILYSDEAIANPVQWFKAASTRFENAAQGFPSSALISLEEGLIWVYRLLITPTKVYCMGPEVEISNRVTREYRNLLDNFLRVSFVDEDWDKIPPAAVCVMNSERRTLAGYQVGSSDIHDRILEVLKEGFVLWGKKYEFLAFSSSQLKEQSVWMFAIDDLVTAASIRSWMGDFFEIRNIAKCAARMGQCFASSTKTMVVNPNEVEHLSDIILQVGADKYCFSDGIGQISESFASVVAARCGCRNRYGRPPSAFQIRYGGYKGVVAVNPWSQYKLSLRPSMKKFDSRHLYVEVIAWTRPVPCYLNRQVITLLSTLGVRDSVFEEMQQSMVSKLNQLLENSQAAIEVLQATGMSHMVTLEMLKAGYHPQSEPYLLGLLHSFRASQIARVRSKSRILVPKGRCLMGCLDETAQLAYGEVFLQVSSNLGRQSFVDDGLEDFRSFLHQNDNNGIYVVTGPVVVTKSPCLHPGDIRVLNAVNIPQLNHMVDCVVFPQRGPRPHPNECSGSDLDGDLYFVTWDPLLIPSTTDVPTSYTAERASELSRDVTTEDIQEFFIRYMINDSLGLIANSHCALADDSEDMARDPKCLELARLHSVAVDFPKTGVAAVIPRDLRPQRFPDFMGKDKNKPYESEKVLGKLYRSLSPLMHTFKTSFTKTEIGKSFDQELIIDGDSFREYLDEAWKLKMCYDMKLLSLMNQYDIKTEMEAISGNFSSPSKYFMRGQSEVKERIRMAVNSLRKEARSWFKSGYHGSEGYEIDESIELTEWEKVSKASAWYYVSYHPDYVFREGISKGKHKDVSLISFPWTIHETLLYIKKVRAGSS